MFGFFAKRQLGLVNCLRGKSRVVSTWPVVLGPAPGKPPAGATTAGALECRIEKADWGRLTLTAPSGAEVFIDGERASVSTLTGEAEHALLIGRSAFLLSHRRDAASWVGRINTGLWNLLDRRGARVVGPLPPAQVASALDGAQWDSTELQLAPEGAKAGFRPGHLRFWFERLAPEAPPPGQAAEAAVEGSVPAPPAGRHTCPTCWIKFDTRDVMHVAVHQSLRGDDILGPSAMKRFVATRFDAEGRALDPMGLPTGSLACPRCHHGMPPNFLEVDHHIISIAGAPTSGKSYFLTVLSQQARRAFVQKFGATFMDADPTANAALSAMRHKLFGGSTPGEAYLHKTQLEGDMYRTVLRNGSEVRLPCPFVFNIIPSRRSEAVRSLTFYDNAGEHFEPGIDEVRSPGAQHLAAASGIIFLFDPTYNAAFRRELHDHDDPQLRMRGHTDQQDTILTEINARLRRLTGLGASGKLGTPLAFVVGKYDVWERLLPRHELADPMSGAGGLDLAAVEQNSGAVRRLLGRLMPEIVHYAAAISHHVRFFPMSSFGHSPVSFADPEAPPAAGGDAEEAGRNRLLGPDPLRMNPFLVEVPLLWILSRVDPALLAPTEPGADPWHS